MFSFCCSLLYTLFLCSTVSNLYNNNYNCLFDILLTQLFAISHTMEIFKPRLFRSHTTLHKTNWILTDSLSALSCPFICASQQYDEDSGIENFIAIKFFCVLCTQCFWLLWHTSLSLLFSCCCCWFTCN